MGRQKSNVLTIIISVTTFNNLCPITNTLLTIAGLSATHLSTKGHESPGNNALSQEEEREYFHYTLEESSNSEEGRQCGLYEASWPTRVEDMVERTVDTYTYNHHSLEKCGHIVPDVQSTPTASLQTGPYITVRLLL